MTAIGVVRTTEEVVIAADSMAIGFDGPTKTLCKIHDLNNGVFAATYGLNNHDEPDFDMPSLLAVVRSKGPRTVSEAFQLVEEQITQPFSKVIQHAQTANDPLLDRLTRGLTGMFIACYERQPVFGTINFRVVINGSQFSIDVQPEFAPASPRSSALMPNSPGSEAYIARNWPLRNGMTPSAYATGFVQQEIDNGTPGVGPPINVLRLTSTGPEWTQVPPL